MPSLVIEWNDDKSNFHATCIVCHTTMTGAILSDLVRFEDAHESCSYDGKPAKDQAANPRMRM